MNRSLSPYISICLVSYGTAGAELLPLNLIHALLQLRCKKKHAYTCTLTICTHCRSRSPLYLASPSPLYLAWRQTHNRAGRAYTREAKVEHGVVYVVGQGQMSLRAQPARSARPDPTPAA